MTNNINIENAIKKLLPKLQEQIQTLTKKQEPIQLETNLRTLLKNRELIKSITQAQLKILQKAADTCKNQGQTPGMFSSLWQKVLKILENIMNKKEKTDEDVERITEINRIIYNSLIHPTRNDLTNMDISINRKGFGWKDDFDSIDNQLALLKLSSSNNLKLKRELVNTNKQRITQKTRDDKNQESKNPKQS